MFIGREKELSDLKRRYNSDRFEFAVIYGRRRVGKTALINEFIKDKNAIFFTGVESNEKQNLENLSKNILEHGSGINADTSFSSFQAAFEYVFELAQTQRLILVIDEYPYVARATKSLASTLQLLIDRYKDTSKLFLILCGSSMSYMEDHVLAYKAPLYGRRTAQFRIHPFDFSETCRYVKNYSPEEKALIYGIIGGTPQYLLQIDDKLSIEDNVKNLYLNPSSAIYEEPTNLLKQEVREPAIYNAIITAIATGSSKLSEISTKIGEESSVCVTYIKNLIMLGIIKKEFPYGEETSRKTIYSIEDNMFRFWYRFVPSNSSLISRGMADLVYKRIEPQLSDHMGTVFEEICKQYLWKQLFNGTCTVEFTDLGRWWGTDPATHRQEEIDIIGEADHNTLLLGECKWTNEKVDKAILETLIYRGHLFRHAKKHYYLFSKTGFTQGCRDIADDLRNISLICLDDIIKAQIVS